MRVTTQMVNESAQRAGLPGIGNTLLDATRMNNNNDALLNALTKKTGTSKSGKLFGSDYEKIGKAADELEKNASLFTEAEKSGDNENMRKAGKELAEAYNKTLISLEKSTSSLDRLYYAKLKETVTENKDSLSSAGVKLEKNGKLTIDAARLNEADSETLIKAFGSAGSFAEKAGFLGAHIADNADRMLESVSNRYSASGLTSSAYTNKYDFWG